MTFEVGSATYTFALPASADTLRLPDELAPDDEVRVEAILFDRSLRQLGLHRARTTPVATDPY